MVADPNFTYSYYEVPLIASPQAFSIQLGGTTYNLVFLYHTANAGFITAPVGIATNDGSQIDTNVIGGWVLDINDIRNQPIVCGIPLVTGIDLLYQYKYLGFGGSLVVSSDGSPTTVPTFTNLGTISHLYFVVVTPNN